MLELFGGVDYLHGFIEHFPTQYKFYKASKPQNPTIIILDNDKGTKGLLNYVASIPTTELHPTSLDKKKDLRKAKFIHIMHNLYIVLTPLSPKSDPTDIEYLFDDAARLTRHNGKCFNTVDKRDEKSDLSKDAFAKHIIKTQKGAINFDGLKPLLNRITAAISHYDSIK